MTSPTTAAASAGRDAGTGGRYTEPPWSDLSLDLQPDRPVLVATLVGAVATDVALHTSGPVGVGGAVLVAVVAAVLLGSKRLENPQALAAAAAAPVFGVWMALRTSPWLLVLDILVAAALFATAASFARGGSLFDLTIPGLVTRAAHGVLHGASAPGFLMRAQQLRLGRAMPVVRGLLVAVPIVVVLGLLLSSADAVFASFLPRFTSDLLVEHLVLLLVGGWAVAGLLRLASATPMKNMPSRAPGLGKVEALVVLGSLVLLYAGFAVAQLVALSDGGKRVIETAGLTYAEYARSGFFQLLAAAVITLAILLAVRAFTRPDGEGGGRRLIVLLAEAAVALTLVVVFVAARRLQLYEQAFGLTMLRLYSFLFALWIGGVFVLLGGSLAGLGAPRRWFLSSALGVGLIGILVLNALNPEALVVRRNIAHAERTGRFDAYYAAELSDDALPALAGSMSRLDPFVRQEAETVICSSFHDPGSERGIRGLFAYNRSRQKARAARLRLCGEELRLRPARRLGW